MRVSERWMTVESRQASEASTASIASELPNSLAVARPPCLRGSCTLRFTARSAYVRHMKLRRTSHGQ